MHELNNMMGPTPVFQGRGLRRGSAVVPLGSYYVVCSRPNDIANRHCFAANRNAAFEWAYLPAFLGEEVVAGEPASQ